MTLTTHTPESIDLSLASGAVLDVVPTRAGVAIDVRQGRLWITQTGDPVDHILGAGESFRTRAAGLLVVQALEPSVLGTR